MGEGQADVLHADTHLVGTETINRKRWKLSVVKLKRGLDDEVRGFDRRAKIGETDTLSRADPSRVTPTAFGTVPATYRKQILFFPLDPRFKLNPGLNPGTLSPHFVAYQLESAQETISLLWRSLSPMKCQVGKKKRTLKVICYSCGHLD